MYRKTLLFAQSQQIAGHTSIHLCSNLFHFQFANSLEASLLTLLPFFYKPLAKTKQIEWFAKKIHFIQSKWCSQTPVPTPQNGPWFDLLACYHSDCHMSEKPSSCRGDYACLMWCKQLRKAVELFTSIVFIYDH